MTDYPHVPAAFINAIAEGGTKDDAIRFLQLQWDECCALHDSNKRLVEALRVSRPYVETCADDDLPNAAATALKMLDLALELAPAH